MSSRRPAVASEAESASTGTSLDAGAAANAVSPPVEQESLKRQADEARAELDKLRQANEHLQELVLHFASSRCSTGMESLLSTGWCDGFIHALRN